MKVLDKEEERKSYKLLISKTHLSFDNIGVEWRPVSACEPSTYSMDRFMTIPTVGRGNNGKDVKQRNGHPRQEGIGWCMRHARHNFLLQFMIFHGHGSPASFSK